jgi:hypothetical protein
VLRTDPVLALVWTLYETGVTNTIRLCSGVLVEDWILVLAPVGRIHGVSAHKLEECKAIVSVVGAGSAIDDELLARLAVCKLLWSFVGGQAVVRSTAIWSLLPWEGGY